MTMTLATPSTMPSIVSAERNRCAARLRRPSRIVWVMRRNIVKPGNRVTAQRPPGSCLLLSDLFLGRRLAFRRVGLLLAALAGFRRGAGPGVERHLLALGES